ncbi:MAG: energy transducer TonB, partial [Xanthomonadaceae bacterium]|nr:energy transducer TonB [Xanthomonadaceae bacterium]
FDQAAIRAVEQSTYKPALKDGEPVSAVLQRRVDFKFGG